MVYKKKNGGCSDHTSSFPLTTRNSMPNAATLTLVPVGIWKTLHIVESRSAVITERQTCISCKFFWGKNKTEMPQTKRATQVKIIITQRSICSLESKRAPNWERDKVKRSEVVGLNIYPAVHGLKVFPWATKLPIINGWTGAKCDMSRSKRRETRVGWVTAQRKMKTNAFSDEKTLFEWQ